MTKAMSLKIKSFQRFSSTCCKLILLSKLNIHLRFSRWKIKTKKIKKENKRKCLEKEIFLDVVNRNGKKKNRENENLFAIKNQQQHLNKPTNKQTLFLKLK